MSVVADLDVAFDASPLCRSALLAVVVLVRWIVGTRAEKLDSHDHAGMAGQRGIVNLEAVRVEALQLIDEQLKVRLRLSGFLGPG